MRMDGQLETPQDSSLPSTLPEGDCGGGGVSKFSVGDIAGVSAVVKSCGTCSECREGLEIFCPEMVLTYSARDHDGSITRGGYSDNIVVDQSTILISADVEVIPMHYLNAALHPLANNDVKYPFVIDVANTINYSSP
ncbi:putative mannitol dehydrogenase [Senna tora]|uniref:Putative mannitol dehydrogenase n=1 Tax=Senna tora TaxID=362788 RepID=A0A834SS21_9FABA|nr:putative mannitol dehydrogenase [Senna tora]